MCIQYNSDQLKAKLGSTHTGRITGFNEIVTKIKHAKDTLIEFYPIWQVVKAPCK
jgi:hypothetical protein